MEYLDKHAIYIYKLVIYETPSKAVGLEQTQIQ